MATANLPRLKQKYDSEIIPKIKEFCGRANRLAIPKLDKIVVSCGFGRAVTQGEKGVPEEAIANLTQITAQKPTMTVARKSVANFRLREGMKIGCKVTIRGARMYEFLDRLITIALPRVRDFRGVSSKGFDGTGNYSLGLTEQGVFPEINLDKMKFNQGMNITIVVKNASDSESHELLKMFGFPFRTKSN